MSILFENDSGTFLSAEKYINNMIDMKETPKINTNLFKIISPYTNSSKHLKKARRQKAKVLNQDQEVGNKPYPDFENAIKHVQNKYAELLPILKSNGILKVANGEHSKNVCALEAAEFVYEESGKHLIKNALGSNFGCASIRTIQNAKFIFPENCQFLCKDISEIDTHLLHEKFDLILLDPPWWNKYIRRKRKKSPHAYNMMYNCDLSKVPIESLLLDTGIVVVWCTNSIQHVNMLVEDIFPKWNVNIAAKWYWLKVTVHGETICEFSKPPGKQPFEQIIIGYRDRNNLNITPNGKLLISVPSAVHSHKPPLMEVLKPFLPENPKCLEIFARYLLPNWTSYGNEVLRFQHESLYTFNKS